MNNSEFILGCLMSREKSESLGSFFRLHSEKSNLFLATSALLHDETVNCNIVVFLSKHYCYNIMA